jgi:hypothetical protein
VDLWRFREIYRVFTVFFVSAGDTSSPYAQEPAYKLQQNNAVSPARFDLVPEVRVPLLNANRDFTMFVARVTTHHKA